MRKNILLILLLIVMVAPVCAIEQEGYRLPGVITPEGDTIGMVYLRDLYVFPKMKFKNKRQEKFFWRTVRDVKKTLPYAKIIAKEMVKTDSLMAKMTPKQQRKYWRGYEKLLFQQYEGDFRHMTASQGQMLMKLVDRETDKTSYQVIQMYKGSFVANFWQGIARLFGNNLKEDYDGSDKDQIIERIILLVENGQL